MLKEFFLRTILSLLIIIVLAFFIYYAGVPFISGVIFLLTASIAGIGVWEFQNLVRKKQIKVSIELPVLFSILFIAAIYLSRFFANGETYPIIVLLFSLLLIWMYHFREIDQAILKIASNFFSICYVAVPLGFLLLILYPFHPLEEFYDGRIWLGFLIITTKLADVGAYVVGKTIKGKKLAPRISPNKTISGAIAGLIFSVAGSMLYFQLMRRLQVEGYTITAHQSFYLGIVFGFFGQVGDLAESLLKRDAVVKDSNRIPGLGGVLDTIDSILFTAPILYFFLLLRGLL